MRTALVTAASLLLASPVWAGGSHHLSSNSAQNTQSNSGSINQAPVGGINHNTQIINDRLGEYSFGPGIYCPTSGLAFSGSYAGASGGFDGYSASVSYVIPFGGSIGASCRDLAVEITKQRQLDTQLTMIRVCADLARTNVQLDPERFPEFSDCDGVRVTTLSDSEH